ncbi:MAG: aminotransferase class IV [Flavobacteriales bacterium]
MKQINYKGNLYPETEILFSINHLRSMFLTECIMVKDGNILFWEDHYFRLMASMRILRMAIPMYFTPEYLQSQVVKVLESNVFHEGLVLFSFFETNGEVCFWISPSVVHAVPFWDDESCCINILKECKLTPRLLSSLSFHTLPELHLAAKYAREHHWDDVILVNTQNKVVRTLWAHIFLIKADEIYTPRIEEGCEKTVARQKFVEYLRHVEGRIISEREIFPYELQTADEVFLFANLCIRPVHSYRKKTYEAVISKEIFQALHRWIAAGSGFSDGLFSGAKASI